MPLLERSPGLNIARAPKPRLNKFDFRNILLVAKRKRYLQTLHDLNVAENKEVSPGLVDRHQNNMVARS